MKAAETSYDDVARSMKEVLVGLAAARVALAATLISPLPLIDENVAGAAVTGILYVVNSRREGC